MILVMVGMIFHTFSKTTSLLFWCQMLEHDRQSLDVYAHASTLELKVWRSLELLNELNFNGKKSFLKTGEIVSLSWISAALLGKDIHFGIYLI